MIVEAIVVVMAAVIALATRPWRLYQQYPDPQGDGGGRVVMLVARLGPALALLAVLPVLWTLPGPAPIAAQMHWSGAGLATLMLGWPVAVPVLLLVAILAGFADPSLGAADLLARACWQGVVPATLSLAIGIGLRRLLGERIFVYLLGRAFLGTVIAVFTASLLESWLHAAGPPSITGSATVARWLMAWGDGIVTGMLASVFVAFAPHALATWSDQRYLHGSAP